MRRGRIRNFCRPDLAVVDIENAVTVRGEERCVAVTDEDWLSAGGDRLNDDLERRGALEVGRVGRLAVGSGLGAVGVGNGRGVGRPRELGDVLRIVLVIVRELAGDLVWSGDPEIVVAFSVAARS